MATISPVDSVIRSNSGLNIVTWKTLTESDTAAAYSPNSLEPIVGCVQVIGTFGGATVILQGSNDGTNWVGLKDTSGTAISLTAAGAAEFSTAMVYIRPSASGGSSQDLDIIVSLRY